MDFFLIRISLASHETLVLRKQSTQRVKTAAVLWWMKNRVDKVRNRGARTQIYRIMINDLKSGEPWQGYCPDYDPLYKFVWDIYAFTRIYSWLYFQWCCSHWNVPFTKQRFELTFEIRNQTGSVDGQNWSNGWTPTPVTGPVPYNMVHI